MAEISYDPRQGRGPAVTTAPAGTAPSQIDEAKRQKLLELVRGRALARPTDLAEDEVMVWPSLVVVEAVSATVFLHMTRVFFTGSYKPPREFNWVIGVLLLVITFLLSFTGYLLPWDQLALWAITVGTNIGGAAPIVGSQVNFLLTGDYQIGQAALIRFYALHVIFLPLAAAFLMAVHFWRIRKDGGISGPL